VLILAFGHQSRVGKDTCASAVVEALGPNSAVRRSFAAPLKDVAHRLFARYGLLPGDFYERPGNEHFRGQKLHGIDKTPVDLWIEVGQAMRAIHPDVWLDAGLEPDVCGRLIVVSDIRFRNEVEAVRRLGGWCVRVVRPDAPPPKGSDNMIGADFVWDAEIVNDGTIEELRAKAVALAKDYLRANARKHGFKEVEA